MKKLLTFALILGASCGETTTTPPSQLNLDRPSDMTFACVGGLRIIPDSRADQTMGDPNDEVVLSAQPTPACDIRSGIHDTGTPVPVPPGQDDLTADGGIPIGSAFWFSFILQSGQGTVALAQFQTKPSTAFAGADVQVLDADPLTPGKNGISIGEDPIAIATDRTGCKVVTANAGSCDLSVLDVTTAVDQDPATPIDVRRLAVTTPNGTPLRAKPAAMVAEPQTDVIGKKCADTATGLVYIAYPSCHIVAAVDAATGVLRGGIQYDNAGVASPITDLDAAGTSCVDECSGGKPPSDGIRPVTLDLEKDPRTANRRLIIGADNSAAVTVVELDDVDSLPEATFQIALEDTAGTLGITQVSLSPQIGMGGELGQIDDEIGPGGQFQFVYAIATDHTIRVADILNLKKECDTQVDSRYLRSITDVRLLSCLPVGDPATPPRRANSRGPGIQLIGDALPMSVDIIKSEAIDGDARNPGDPGRLIGYFGIIGASNGGVFIVNIDDDDRSDLFSTLRPLLTPMALQVAHQVRDAISNRGQLATVDVNNVTENLCDIDGPEDVTGLVEGGPRTTATPARNIPLGTYAPEKVFQLPGFRQFQCVGVDTTKAVTELQFTAPEAVRDLVYPDLAGTRTEEAWTLIWEGTLSLDRIDIAVDGPVIRESEMRIDGSGLHLVDGAKPFCSAGVERFDLVQMRGCDSQFGNSDCPTGYRCFVHPSSQLQGIGACLLEDEADRLADTCQAFLTSLRRYTVGATKSGDLQLLPRRHTLRTTPVEGCDTDTQCQSLADYALTQSVSQHPSLDDTDPDTHTWTCNPDPLRGAVATGKRCQMRCDATADCLTGTVCQGGTGSGKAGFCMEGVLPPQACINAPQRYEMRVGEAFAVIGQRTGFQHATVADANGNCVRDPAANPYLTSRIPLTPPACDPTAEAISGRKPDGTFEPNPCSLTVETVDVVPQYEANSCELKVEPTALVPRQASAIRYRNRALNMTLVDPTYPGDDKCILDRGGTLGNIPHVFTNFQLSFTQTAGFAQISIPVQAALPVRVVRGPTQSIWVVDQGDFLSTSVSLASTRGKVFRIEPGALNLINILE